MGRGMEAPGTSAPAGSALRQVRNAATAKHVNHVETQDFVHDRPEAGRTLKILIVAAKFNGFNICVHVRRSRDSFDGRDREERSMQKYGGPAFDRRDDSLEFIDCFLAKHFGKYRIRCGAGVSRQTDIRWQDKASGRREVIVYNELRPNGVFLAYWRRKRRRRICDVKVLPGKSPVRASRALFEFSSCRSHLI